MRYTKTPLGQQAFKERSPLLSHRQRSLFLLFDGQKKLSEILVSVSSLGVIPSDVEHLIAQGFIEPLPGEGGVQVNTEPAPLGLAEVDVLLSDSMLPTTPLSNQERYLLAMPIATKLTASLGLRGFRLNLAVEAASGYEQLLALLPQIREAVGSAVSKELEQVLKG